MYLIVLSEAWDFAIDNTLYLCIVALVSFFVGLERKFVRDMKYKARFGAKYGTGTYPKFVCAIGSLALV